MSGWDEVARAHSGNYLQIKIPLCTPKYSPLWPLSSATVVADSGVGGGSGGGSSSTRSSSSSSSSNVADGCWWSRRYQLERKR
uniref:Uncharacterized protein n=1 Tax=Vespula pensylvanica TaxID=30213 RepID=A0A834NZX0_VESPE|nr:hypothetical protein H0235_008519 [Vespula pensylvanica]